MAPKKVTPELEDALIAAYVGGASLESVGEQQGCSPEGVRNVLVRRGIPRRPRGVPANPVLPTKICSSCTLPFPRTEFYGEGKRSSECRGCLSKKSEDRYASDPSFRQRKIEASASWQDANREKARESQRRWARRVNGWLPEAFEQAWVKQGGRCAICKVPLLRTGTASSSVHADHDHRTGRPRSLLCSKCNRGLGCFRDSFELLREAVGYLQAHQGG